MCLELVSPNIERSKISTSWFMFLKFLEKFLLFVPQHSFLFDILKRFSVFQKDYLFPHRWTTTTCFNFPENFEKTFELSIIPNQPIFISLFCKTNCFLKNVIFSWKDSSSTCLLFSCLSLKHQKSTSLTFFPRTRRFVPCTSSGSDQVRKTFGKFSRIS